MESGVVDVEPALEGVDRSAAGSGNRRGILGGMTSCDGIVGFEVRIIDGYIGVVAADGAAF